MKKSKIRVIAIYGGHAMLAVIAIAIVFMVIFAKRINRTIREDVTADIANELKYCAEAYSRMLYGNASATDFMRDFVVSGEATEEDLIKSLRAIKQTTDCYQVMYVTKDLTAYDYESVKYDLSSVEYAGIFGSAERGFYYTSNDGLKNSEALIIYNPIIDGSGSVVAYVIEFMDINGVVEDLSSTISYGYSFYAIMDSNNEIVTIVGRDQSSEFLLEDLADSIDENMDKGNPSWSVLVDSYIAKGIQKVVHISSANEGRYVINAPVKNAKWNIIAFVSDSYVEYEREQSTAPVRVLMIEYGLIVSLVMAVYIVIMIIIFMHTRETKKELEGKAETDLLTGLNNKLTTELKIAEYIRDNPDGQGVFLLIDVDNFKKVNDTMGHAFGDEVLRTLGVKLRSLYRSTDIIGRIGGDEFIVFLRDVKDVTFIVREAKKLETFFEDFKVGEYVKYTVTASLGAAVYSMDGNSFEELYKNADSALYEAKHKGKKQLAFYNADQKDFLKTNAQ